MAIEPFSDKTINDVVVAQWNKIQSKIEKLTNEEIMANDIDILAENLYQKFYIAPVTIHEEDFSKRTIKQGKVRKYINSFLRGYYDQEYVDVDGVIGSFHFPFDGDGELFKCRASTFSLGGYPKIELGNGEIIFSVSKSLDEMQRIGKDRLIAEINGALKDIKQGISYANSDINQFNSGLKPSITKLLYEKKSKVEAFFNIATMFEVPIEKKEYAQKHIPVQRNIVPIAHKYDSEDYYDIKDADYKDILESIKHTASTYERTPGSYKSMQEEDLRNTLLAALNATYKGDATGETFRNKGKTDICIEQKNRAAFVAECKMWTGPKEVETAVFQLDGYLTWRDCKTALIYFVRRKDFLKVLEKAKEALTNVEGMKNVKEVDKNEFECLLLSKANVGQQVKIRVMLFNLFSE